MTAVAAGRYSAGLGVDCSTVDALLRKVGLLREQPNTLVAGRMAALLHSGSRLPAQLWDEPDPRADDATHCGGSPAWAGREAPQIRMWGAGGGLNSALGRP